MRIGEDKKCQVRSDQVKSGHVVSTNVGAFASFLNVSANLIFRWVEVSSQQFEE